MILKTPSSTHKGGKKFNKAFYLVNIDLLWKFIIRLQEAQEIITSTSDPLMFV